MTAKQLLYREDARDKIRRGVNTMADAVKVTLGPRGRTVIIDRDFGPPQIVNSGVVVAKAIELEDRFENMGHSCCARSPRAPAKWPATGRPPPSCWPTR